MKKIIRTSLAIAISSMLFVACHPNDDKGAMDQENSQKEGAIDSSRLTQPDTSGINSASPDSVR